MFVGQSRDALACGGRPTRWYHSRAIVGRFCCVPCRVKSATSWGNTDSKSLREVGMTAVRLETLDCERENRRCGWTGRGPQIYVH